MNKVNQDTFFGLASRCSILHTCFAPSQHSWRSSQALENPTSTLLRCNQVAEKNSHPKTKTKFPPG
jgi:hypothetical protein